jgi:hypothetical protein
LGAQNKDYCGDEGEIALGSFGVALLGYKRLPLEKSECKGRPANRPYRFDSVVLSKAHTGNAIRKYRCDLPT